MKAIIIEDEHLAAQALTGLLREVAPEIQIIAVLQSIDESVEWFQLHDTPDLVFMDIHLADGSSFSIFESVDISCPIIFTTAYDQYALRAFDVNSVDYLLKPVDKSHLERAIRKFRNIKNSTEIAENNSQLIEKLVLAMRQSSAYKSTLLIPVKDKLIPLAVKTLAYIYTENKIVRAVGFDGSETFIEQTLEELASQLDSRQFYRANRQYIVSRSAVKDISLWFNGRLSVNLTVKTPDRILVSRLNVKEFKEWLTE